MNAASRFLTGTLAIACAHGALAAEPVTFTKDIAPIFQRACQTCHRPGQIAPMSLLTYQETRPWVKAIRTRVAAREMPPWHADPLVGHYVNDRSLSDDEVKTIVEWADAGAPQGDPADLPATVEWPKGWTIGEPDLILKTDRPYRVSAYGRDQFVDFTISPRLTEDQFIRAVEIRPGDPRVVHHVLAYIHQPDNYDFRDEASFENSIGRGGTLLTEYAVGNNGDVFPPGTGRLLKRGGYITLEIHYHSYGEAITDHTQIGLQFHPKDSAQQRIISRWIGESDLYIPPNRKDVPSSGAYTFRRPVYIVSFQPHMHCRGQAMRATAVYPDGRSEIIFDVPNFDFNWQTTYTYSEPPLLPAGTRLVVDAKHDNSSGNPNNPDPNRYVTWGQQTTDEMMHLWTDFVYADEGFSRPETRAWTRDSSEMARVEATDPLIETRPEPTPQSPTNGVSLNDTLAPSTESPAGMILEPLQPSVAQRQITQQSRPEVSENSRTVRVATTMIAATFIAGLVIALYRRY
jgi:hypothetical protein